MNVFDAVRLRVLRAILRSPEPIARLITGPPAVSEGVALDLRTHLFCRLAERYNPTEAHEDAQIPARRFEQDKLSPTISDPVPDDVQVQPFTLHLPGRSLDAELIRPPGADLPALIWFHGGGFVMGSLTTHRGGLARLAKAAGCILVHVHYRLAPEHRFPSAHEDAWEAFAALQRLAPSLGLHPQRLAIGGDSAGANLAASVCNRFGAEGLPGPFLQVLLYPGTDSSQELPSYEELATGYFMTRSQVRWYIDHLVTCPEDRVDPRLSPLQARSLEGTAPAVVITAGFDVLRDEGRAYAARLQEVGSLARHVHEPGLIHGFLNFAGALEACRDGVDRLGAVLFEELRSGHWSVSR
jgi:acetyl esterase